MIQELEGNDTNDAVKSPQDEDMVSEPENIHDFDFDLEYVDGISQVDSDLTDHMFDDDDVDFDDDVN